MIKKILITGENSYIGNQLAEWLYRESEKYVVTKKSVRNDRWKEIDFSNFDVVVHVAGIAHMKEKKSNVNLYYEVNKYLSINIAKKAKKSGVQQFIYLSSMSVYGDLHGAIDLTSETRPTNHYGKSKLDAEKNIRCLAGSSFRVAIIRPPMVYGKSCVGNYVRLSKLAKQTKIFPQFVNKRSMIHIDNLSEFMRLVIQNGDSGTFLPQNKEYVCTSEMVKCIASHYNNNVKMIYFINPFLSFFSTRMGIIKKIFGDLYYTKEASHYKENYNIWGFNKSIELTEDDKSE